MAKINGIEQITTTDPNGNIAEVNATGELNTSIYDSAGNPIASHLTADGDYHLATMFQQDVQADPNNTSSVNLSGDSNYTFTGEIIGVINSGGKDPSPVSLEYGVPFNDGLFIVSVGTWDATIVYE